MAIALLTSLSGCSGNSAEVGTFSPFGQQVEIQGSEGVVVDPARQGVLRGKLNNAVTGEPILGATVTGQGVTVQLIGDGSGLFFVRGLPTGTYEVTISAPGFQPLRQTITVTNDVTSFAQIQLQPEVIPRGNIIGTITNAVNVQPAEGVTIIGPNGIQAISNANGQYQIAGAPVGTYTIVAGGGALGFIPEARQVTVVENQATVADFLLSTRLAPGQYRFVLTWGQEPPDLDSHLVIPSFGANSSQEVDFTNKGSVESYPFANLDVDDVTSFGPETTTISRLVPGTYRFFIDNFSNSGSFAGATVRIFGENGLITTVQPPNVGGNTWDVATLNGSTGEVTVVNTVSP